MSLLVSMETKKSIGVPHLNRKINKHCAYYKAYYALLYKTCRIFVALQADSGEAKIALCNHIRKTASNESLALEAELENLLYIDHLAKCKLDWLVQLPTVDASMPEGSEH